jgi:hypothetical protein
MKDSDICSEPWCREPYVYTIFERGNPWSTRKCENHASRYFDDKKFIVEERPQREAARKE